MEFFKNKWFYLFLILAGVALVTILVQSKTTFVSDGAGGYKPQLGKKKNA